MRAERERGPTRRDFLGKLSGPVFNIWIVYWVSTGTTSVPLRKIPEGPACQVRLSTFDMPLPSAGTEVPRRKRG